MRLILRIQLILFVIFYFLLNYKFFTKNYNPMFYEDLLFGRIPLFWFLHLTLLGGFLVLIAIFISRKFEAKKNLFIQILFLIYVLVFFLLLECVFRIRPDYLPLTLIERLGFSYQDKAFKNKFKNTVLDKYNEDPELGIIHQPNLSFLIKTSEFSYPFKTDNKGLSNWQDESLYDQSDIVTLGDSFVEGVGTQQELSYPRILAQLTQKRVLNLGHCSYDAYHYPIMLKRFGIKSSPKTVIATIWTDNDLQERYFKWADRYKATKITWEQSQRDFKDKYFVKNKRVSYAWEFIHSMFTEMKYYYQAVWNYGPYRSLSINGNKVNIYLKEYFPGNQKDIQLDLFYLDQIVSVLKKQAKDYHFRLLMVYIPSKEEVYYRFIQNLNKNEKDKLNWIHDPVIEYLKNNHVEVVDMMPVFLNLAGQGKQIYYMFDSHLKPYGYQILAETVADYLKM